MFYVKEALQTEIALRNAGLSFPSTTEANGVEFASALPELS